jgi:ubiquinone/menaquinone biosynthesis C-methylase UbiE
MSWELAGEGWGHRAREWAYLVEPYARPANEKLFERLQVGDGVRLLDIACGSGFAAHLAAERGAIVSGLDAAEPLLAIARARTPTGDFRLGDMLDLPFDDESFDVATSFNGIWKGFEGALVEARRVLRPGGLFGMTFWGSPRRLGLLPFFMKVGEFSPPSHVAATVQQGDTGRPGVVEEMLASSGLELIERGRVEVVNEWPDLDTAAHAMAASGPAVPAIESIGYEAFVEQVATAWSGKEDPHVGVRITSEFGWVTARKPS